MKRFIALLASVVISSATLAGSQNTQARTFSPESIAEFAKSVEHYAAGQGAHAFIIARVGRPQENLPKGIQYTHTAVAVYSAITLANGDVVNGYAIHNLYQDSNDPNRSALMTDYPVDFFWGAHTLKAGIIIPAPELQQKLIALIAKGNNQVLHNPRYSVIANPFNKQYQNCTEHTLDMLNAAIYNTLDKDRIKRNTQAYFAAQPIHVSRFKLALGSAFADGVTMRDHKGPAVTTTFTSIHRYLDQYDLSAQAITMMENGDIRVL